MRKAAFLIGLGLVLGPMGPALADFESPAPPKPQADPEPGKRAWDLSARAFYGKDSNSALVPDVTTYNGHKESENYGLSLQGAYRFYQDRDWSLGATLTVDMLHNTQGKDPGQADAPSEYNLGVINPGLFVRRNFRLDGKPGSFGVSYDFREESWDTHAGHSLSHNVNADANIFLTPEIQVGANLGWGKDDFEVVFANMVLNDRDARRNTAGLFARYWIKPRVSSVTVRYGYAENNAIGTNWQYTGHTLTAQAQGHLAGPVWGEASFSRDTREYPNGYVGAGIPAPGRTAQDIDTFSARVLWVITRDWIADAHYRITNNDATLPQFTSTRKQVGVGITYKF
ncbi:MAG: hypothetical protein KDE22_14040 [Rhodobacterales bacterium]|nr:hypothetical protein [Rhodobacterales bacterium]